MKKTSKEMENMTLEEFKIFCEDNSDNLKKSWDFNLFGIVCKKCKSNNVVHVDTREFNAGSSCPTCGYDSYTTGIIIIKCLNCGNALQILNPD